LKDSLALDRWDSLNGEALHANQNHALKLGLDLQGGMYITMEVDVPGLLYESAQRDAIDPTFEQVIETTRNEAKLSDEPVIDIFTRNFDKIARPKGKTLLSYFDVGALGKDATDEAIVTKLSRNIDDAVDQAVTVMRQRIDKYGVSEPTIQKVAGRRIVVELPGVKDETEVRNLLQTTARLEFKLVKNNAEGAKLFKRIDELLAGKVSTDSAGAKKDTAGAKKTDTTVAGKKDTAKTPTVAKKDSTKTKADSAKAPNTARNDSGKKTDTANSPNTAKNDSANGDTTKDPYKGLSDEEKVKHYRADHPFTTMFQTLLSMKEDEQAQDASTMYAGTQFPDGIYNFYVPASLKKKVEDLLHRSDVKGIFPEDLIVAFSAQPEGQTPGNPNTGFYMMYLLTRDPELTGEYITDAAPGFDPITSKPMVSMQMNAEGADRWAAITGKNIKKRVAIVLDSAVYSAPTVQNKIPNGNSQITGAKDAKDANLLAVVLKAGALKAPVHIIEERVVGPSLGSDSISQGFHAVLGAALLVILFMLIYYAFGGAIADLAVMFNVLLTLSILAALGATLTLPGIGGLVLTIGMAVDANILIYERIREELAQGKSLKTAVNLGYEKAFAAIIDTHITTFMTGAILYFFGTGPIQGFAVTLMIGIAATLFTAVFVTRTVFYVMLDRGTTSINFGQPKLTSQAA
jgi:preprotein translocase subunit SecD